MHKTLHDRIKLMQELRRRAGKGDERAKRELARMIGEITGVE